MNRITMRTLYCLEAISISISACDYTDSVEDLGPWVTVSIVRPIMFEQALDARR